MMQRLWVVLAAALAIASFGAQPPVSKLEEQARIAFRQGRPAEAEQARIAFRQGRPAEAEQALKALLQTRHGDASLLGFLGAVLDQQAKYTEAEPFYKAALALAPRSVPLLNNVGNHYGAAGDNERAHHYFLQVVALNPSHRNANVQIARIAVERKRGAEALVALARLNSLPTDPSITLLRAEALHQAGRNAEATVRTTEVEKAAAAIPSLWLPLGLTLARMEQFDHAEHAFAEALRDQPGNADILYDLGLAAAHAGHFDRAQSVLEAVLASRPGDTAVLFQLGRVYAARKDSLHAIALLGQARKLAPTDPDIVLALARAFEDGSFLGDAAQMFDEYLTLRPNDDAARRDRALAYAATGRSAEGKAELQRHLARFPRDAEAYYDLALVVGENDAQGALVLLAKALRLTPDYASAHFARALFLRLLQRSPEALPDLKAAVTLQPDQPSILMNLGLVYLDLNRPREAVIELRKAALIAPEDRGVLMHLGRALDLCGEDQEARGVLAKLDQLGPEIRMGGRAPVMLDLLKLSPAQILEIRRKKLILASGRSPDDPEVWRGLAETLAHLGQLSEANAAWLRLAQLDASSALFLAAGRTALEFAALDPALALLRRAAQQTPAARFELALAVARAKGPLDGLKELDELPPGDRTADFHAARSLLLDDAGRRIEAQAEIDQTLASGSIPTEAGGIVAVLLLKWGDQTRGNSLSGRLANSQVPPPVMAVVWESAGKRAEADAALAKAERRSPESGEPYLIRGALLTLRGERVRAREVLRFAVPRGEERGRNLAECLKSETAECREAAAAALVSVLR